MATEKAANPQPPYIAATGPALKPKRPPVAKPEYTAFIMSDFPL